MEKLLQVTDLKTYFPTKNGLVKAVDGVSFSVGAGEMVALVAPSGAGKSTLLHIAGLLDTPDAGRVVLEGRDMTGLPDRARTAARLIAQAEAKAQERLVGLEPELARLVAHTVRQIVGDFAREEATYHAALTAMRQFREHRRGRVFAAPDIAATYADVVNEMLRLVLEDGDAEFVA